METAYLSLGSNLGDRLANLNEALGRLEAEEVTVAARSSIYETEPMDVPDQPWFFNMVVRAETLHQPSALLAILLKIEIEMGRHRHFKGGPRTIDLDILLYGCQRVNLPNLQIPHPRMQRRRFVLLPLAELSPHLVEPVSNLTVEELLTHLGDQQQVKTLA